MSNLLRLSTVMLSIGILGAAACSSCTPAEEETSSSSLGQPASYTCGANTHQVGNQCVANATAPSSQPGTIRASGNN